MGARGSRVQPTAEFDDVEDRPPSDSAVDAHEGGRARSRACSHAGRC